MPCDNDKGAPASKEEEKRPSEPGSLGGCLENFAVDLALRLSTESTYASIYIHLCRNFF